ncbi:MAG: ATP-binding cassette domain-containing protein [Eubacteriales bacterium]|nr:ATP-binding cassette domain-containing protein [Eubacteriales bacterium]
MRIDIRDLKKKYQTKTVLDLPALTIEEGSFFGIIGSNGAGKTTLLNILAGLDRPTEGKVTYGTQKTEEIPRRDVTMVFQQPYVLRTTTEKNIGYPLKLRGWSEEKTKERVAGLAEELGLSKLLSQKAWTLSAGEMQKTALARALSFHPRLLLLDEPTANIDPSTTAEIEKILLKINREEGTTIVLITHNLAQAKRLCTDAAFFHNGKLIETAPSNVLLASPEEELTKRFVAGELLI